MILILVKGWSRTKNFNPYILFWFFKLLFHLYLLLLRKLLVVLIKHLKVLVKLKQIRILVFFINYFTVSVTSSINTPESCNHFMIFIISFVSLFKLIKANLFPALTAPFQFIFLSNLFISFKVNFLTNPSKLSLNKRIAMFEISMFPKLRR